MLTFWRYGYESSSIADLTTAMGINPPSLYAAFGDKQRLFLEAMRLYAGDPRDMALAIDAAPTAYIAASDLLTASAAAFTGESTPKGCLITSATASGSTATADVQRAAAKVRDDTKALLCARITRDIDTGILPHSIDAAALAGLVMAVVLGMSGLARDGADRTALMAIAATALGAWPMHLRTVQPQGDGSAGGRDAGHFAASAFQEIGDGC